MSFNGDGWHEIHLNLFPLTEPMEWLRRCEQLNDTHAMQRAREYAMQRYAQEIRDLQAEIG